MANVAETLYRLVEYIQMSIFVRANVDSFKIYQSNAIGGPYVNFLEVPNVESSEPRFKNRVVFSFNPTSLSWDNTVINYIKIAPVTNSIEGPQEGPVKIFPLHYRQAESANSMKLMVFDETDQRWIPANTNMSAFT